LDGWRDQAACREVANADELFFFEGFSRDRAGRHSVKALEAMLPGHDHAKYPIFLRLELSAGSLGLALLGRYAQKVTGEGPHIWMSDASFDAWPLALNSSTVGRRSIGRSRL
jgi:hypothetical protein